MTRRSTRSLLAWSLVGLIGGHQATYALVYRDPGQMTSILDATGHGWLWLAPILVLSALLIALVVGLRGGDPIRSFRWRFTFLALIQGMTFAILEIAERASVHGRAFEDADWLILLVGLSIQAGVALLLALASRVVDRVAAALAAHRAPRPRRRPGSILRPSLGVFPRASAHGLAFAPRAPPVRA
jgi:hypothetical protein